MFKNNASTSKIDQTISQSVNFELTVADIARRSERRAWWVAGSAVVMSLVLLGGYFYVLPLKEKVPYLVIADAYTGTSTAARLTDDTALQRITTSEAINRSNVAHFVLARESYDLAITNLRDWTTVLTMSSGNVSGGYTNLYSSGNPINPYTIYGKDKAIRVRILSITLIGGGGEVPKGATVRFQRSVYNKQNGSSVPLDSKIVTMAFTYKSNLTMDEQQRIENPLGFQVTDYRVDTDYASSPPEEVPSNPKSAESGPAIPGAALPPGTDALAGAAGSAQAVTLPAQAVMPTTPPPPNFGVPGAPAPAAPVAPTGANQGTRRR
ncbi:virB8 family protein [Variovorax sp. Root318D1]|uniref:virB8 family protein n=1 Tax=Variovorax sp. Root318D1 TaxID=1736513 RepID=UPI0009ECB2ED|nr:type IV secretion system protein [Variovorax sp. Root318D1]